MSLGPSSDSKDLSTTFFVDVGKHVASEDRWRTWTCNEAGKEAKIGFFVVVLFFEAGLPAISLTPALNKRWLFSNNSTEAAMSRSTMCRNPQARTERQGHRV